MRTIKSGSRTRIWLNEYPFGEITNVDAYLERSFAVPVSSASEITRAAMKFSGGHEAENLAGAEFIPDDSGVLKIRVPVSGTVVFSPQYGFGYDIDTEIAKQIITQLVLLVYLKSETIFRLGSGTLNITSTGYHFSFSRARMRLPFDVLYILPLLWSDTMQLSDVEVLQRLQMPAGEILSGGKISNAVLFERLSQGLKDENALVRAEIVKQLAKLEHDGVVDILLASLLNDSEIIATTVQALGKIGDSAALLPLIEVLQRDNLPEDAISSIATALSKLNDATAIQPLVDKLQITDEIYARQSIISSLGTLNAKEAIPVLMTIAREESERQLKHTAIKALGNIGDVAALAVLEDDILLKHEDRWISGAAIEAIGAIGFTNDVNILLDLARQDDDEYTKRRIIQTIGELGENSAPIWDFLVEEIRRPDNKFRSTVIEVMNNLNREQAETILVDYLSSLDMDDELSRVVVLNGLVQVDLDKYLHLLLEEAKTGSEQKRAQILSSLGKLQDERAIPTIAQILENADESSDLRVSAAQVLGDIGSKKATPHLISSLDEHDTNIVAQAIYALEKLEDERAIPKLMELLYDTRPAYYHNFFVFTWVEGALRKFDRPDVIEAVNLAFKKRNKLDGYE